jgi:hypothetical protein
MRENTGVAAGIGVLSAFAYTIWAGVIVVMVWMGITVYAIVKWIGAPGDHASATTILVMIVGIVAVYPLLIAVAIYFVGKPMRYPRKRRDKDAEQLSLPLPDAPAD